MTSMKIIIKISFFVLFMIINQGSYANESCQTQIISGFISDTFYQNPDTLVSSLKKSPFNTIATTVAWSVVEKNQGEIDLTRYYSSFDALTKAGYCLIILIDTSGRAMRSDVAKLFVEDLSSLPHDSKPAWIATVAAASNSVDFYGGQSPTFDFSDSKALNLVRNFYRAVLPKLKLRYGSKLVGIAPCVTGECEIKYSQTGFRWESYGPKSQQAFRQFIASKGLAPANMPVMDYGNHMMNGNPKSEPLYPYLQMFREMSLRNYVCTLTDEIERADLRRIGYFGQTFAFPDGIYATGIIEKTSDCFDIAVIDYNFYNGYGVENKPEIIPFLTDYALSLGYKHVLVGAYMERFRNPSTLNVDPKGYDILKSSLHGIRPDSRILGVEIGNLTGDEFHHLTYIPNEVREMQSQKTIARSLPRVAVYASIANSYLWEGEWSNGRQILQDDLVATYAALRSMHGIDVEIVSDETIHKYGLQRYRLVLLPHVSTMPETSRNAIKAYLRQGGKIIADMRVDEYRTDGAQQTDSSLRSALGIGATRAFSGSITLVGGITIDRQDQYVNGFAIAPLKNYRIAFAKSPGAGEGLILRGPNSTVFGFLPLLIQGKERTWALNQFVSEVRRLLVP